MPDVRVRSGVSRRWQMPALVTGITVVSAAAAVRSTVERVHDQVCEARRLRARLAEQRREIGRQRQEMAAVATAVEALVPSARALGSRAQELRQTGEPQGSDAASPEVVGMSTCRIENGMAPAKQAIATLTWVEEQIVGAGDAFVVEAVLAEKQAQEARSVPTLFWPVRGAVSSPFGWRRSPYGDTWEWHPGIDITAAYGTPVRATADGEVVSAGRDRGYGLRVVLGHGRATTHYAHLSAIWVRKGQTVLRGAPLGALGGTGRATAPHLHYEVRLGSEPLDPRCFLTGPVRATFAEERSHACALARARLENHLFPATVRGAAHATTPRAGVAG